jgi:hypothetical protein
MLQHIVGNSHEQRRTFDVVNVDMLQESKHH